MSWIRMDVESVIGRGWDIVAAANDAEHARHQLAAVAGTGGLGAWAGTVASEVHAATAAMERYAGEYLAQAEDMVARAKRLLADQNASAAVGGAGWGAADALYPATMSLAGQTQPTFTVTNVDGSPVDLASLYGMGGTIGGHTTPTVMIGGSPNGEGLLGSHFTLNGSYSAGSWGDAYINLAAVPGGAAVAQRLKQPHDNTIDRLNLPQGSSTTRGPYGVEIGEIDGDKYYRDKYYY